MKCINCDFKFYFDNDRIPKTNKIIRCIQWTCPVCKTGNKEYFPLEEKVYNNESEDTNVGRI